MNFDGRDGVMLVIALAVAYLLVTSLRLSRVGRVKKPGKTPAQPESTKPSEETEEVEEAEEYERPGRLRTWLLSMRTQWFPSAKAGKSSHASHASATPRPQERRDPSYSYSSSLTPSFDEHLFRHNVETELQQLRTEVTELREALGRLQTSRSVSPQYTEAMRLAQRGASARIIADECAISIGEAELVRALSKNSQESPDDDGQYDEDTWEK